LIEKRINKKTKAIIATHIHGLPCDMDALSKICAKHGLCIIEDCAHALGAEYKGKKMGCFGKASFFSLGFGKHLSSFGGGVIVSNDRKLIKNARKFMRECESPSNLELLHKLLKTISLSIFTNPLIFSFTIYPILHIFNYDFITNSFETKISPYGKIPKEYRKRFSNIQSLTALREMKSLDINLHWRIRNASILKRECKSLRYVKFQEYSNSFKHAYLDFAVFVRNRERLMKRLLTEGVDTQQTWLDDCSSLPFFIKDSHPTPISNKLSKGVLYLPIDPWLDEKAILSIAKIFKSAISNIK